MWVLQVAEELRRGILTLYDRHLAADGKSVDYKGLGADPDFQLFVDATAELQKLNISGFSRQERMAFWINMYNVLVVRHSWHKGFPCSSPRNLMPDAGLSHRNEKTQLAPSPCVL